MPTATDRLTEQIVQTNARLDKISDQLGQLCTEMVREFGELRTDLAGFKGRMETSLAVAKWSVTIVVPIVVGLLVWSYSAYARAVRLEDSIVQVREHGKEIDARLSKIAELVAAARKDR